ncbi:MAG: hypothetical protein M3N17_06185, partial [Actinomycetota bacterium]|nr:hypothetical protein [Actinomycetota bacterium]
MSDTETVVAEQEPVAASRVDRRWLIALGVVVGVAVLFLAVVNPLLLGGDGGDEAVVRPEATTTPQPDEAPVDDGVPPGEEGPDRVDPKPPPVKALGARDPFSQLVAAGAPGGGSTTPTDGPGTGTPTDGPGTGPSTAPPPPPG